MNLKFQMVVAVKETTEAVTGNTEKETVSNRTRTHALSYQAVRDLADPEFPLGYP